MSKGLEAFDKVKKFKNDCCMFGSSDIEIDREIEIIETELKDYEMEHTLRIRLENINYELVRENAELKQMIRNFNEAIGEPTIITPSIEKKLKALKIIKDEFEIDFNDKKQTITLQSVEKPFTHIRFSLTREIKNKDKYDLLKEVLLWANSTKLLSLVGLLRLF